MDVFCSNDCRFVSSDVACNADRYDRLTGDGDCRHITKTEKALSGVTVYLIMDSNCHFDRNGPRCDKHDSNLLRLILTRQSTTGQPRHLRASFISYNPSILKFVGGRESKSTHVLDAERDITIGPKYVKSQTANCIHHSVFVTKSAQKSLEFAHMECSFKVRSHGRKTHAPGKLPLEVVIPPSLNGRTLEKEGHPVNPIFASTLVDAIKFLLKEGWDLAKDYIAPMQAPPKDATLRIGTTVFSADQLSAEVLSPVLESIDRESRDLQLSTFVAKWEAYWQTQTGINALIQQRNKTPAGVNQAEIDAQMKIRERERAVLYLTRLTIERR